jgi:para-nitrobenzyl esterase
MMSSMTCVFSLLLATTNGEAHDGGQGGASKPAALPTPTSTLRIDTGSMRGLVVGEKKDIFVYKGIPFAAPPVGELRWKPPQAVKSWPGVRDCFEFGAACPQKIPSLMASIPELAIGAPFSEDCLYLNVWTPAKPPSDKLPVLYWIHGGGFVMGAASQPLYNGEDLARLGCVVVSVNYRLGLFGFLAHPALSAESPDKASGNYGLLDQIEGLRWVKRNIASFGGDPERVAIFGESAGGMSVLALMVAPQTRGLFQRAIVQSAVVMDLPRLRQTQTGRETAEQAGQRFMTACGASAVDDAALLRRLDAKALVQASPSEPGPGAPVHLKRQPMVIAPVVDGHVIPDNPDQLFAAGRQHAVPLIIGNTRDEMAMFMMTSKLPADEAAYLKALQDEFGDRSGALAKAYPGRDAKEIRSSVVQITSDLGFIAETRHIARAHAATGQKTFRYQFSRSTKRGFFQSLGAHHGADLAFVFQRPAARDDQSEMRISQTMGRYWIRFASHGDPNGPDLPSWPAYDRRNEETVDFADDVQILKGHHNDRLDTLHEALRGDPLNSR